MLTTLCCCVVELAVLLEKMVLVTMQAMLHGCAAGCAVAWKARDALVEQKNGRLVEDEVANVADAGGMHANINSTAAMHSFLCTILKNVIL